MEQQFKFLAIKNWKKYQPDKKLRNKEARLPWIKDYTEREQDVDFRGLTFFERALLEALCRLAGRTPSRLIHNDVTYISRETHARRTDIPHIPHAVVTLTARQFLIPTNNEKFYDELRQKDGRGGEGERAPVVSNRVPQVETGEGQGEKPKVGSEGSEGSLATLACVSASAPDDSVPDYFSQRLRRKLTSNEVFVAEGLYQDFLPRSRELPPNEIVDLAEVAIDMQETYRVGGNAHEGQAPVRGFWAWNKTHRTGTKWEFLTVAQMANAWFNGKRISKAKWEAHDPSTCNQCQADDQLLAKISDTFCPALPRKILCIRCQEISLELGQELCNTCRHGYCITCRMVKASGGQKFCEACFGKNMDFEAEEV